MKIKVKLEWNELSKKWLVYFWHPLKGRWFQTTDIGLDVVTWDCMTINWLAAWKLDKNKENIGHVTLNWED